MNIYEFIYSTTIQFYFITFIYLFTILCIIYFIYTFIINTWFKKDGIINYEIFLKHCIQVVSEDNYFMNYGYWNSLSDTTLIEANKSLVNIILEKSRLLEKNNAKILDVGCGYGEQDFDWIYKLDPTNTITAIDISESQIQYAKGKCIQLNLESRISFEHCDAMLINKKYAKNTFNTVISLESAFHYSDRPKFFKTVYDVLEDGGVFVISDIVLNEKYRPDILNRVFLRIFSDFLHIPSQNLIKSSEWEESIKDSGLTILESIDITDNTFKPYYKHFFHTYMKKYGMPSIATGLYNFFIYTQPFSYRIAICSKSIV